MFATNSQKRDADALHHLDILWASFTLIGQYFFHIHNEENIYILIYIVKKQRSSRKTSRYVNQSDL